MEYTSKMKPNILGKNLIRFPVIDSTNNYASKLINETNIPNGTVILADFQTNGRGQRENFWDSEPLQNLTFSTIYFPNALPINQQYSLNKAVALGIVNFCNHFLPSTLNSCIKWPNDILINEKKACGILIENVLNDKMIKSSIIGIGININQKNFDNNLKATSIYLETNKENDLDKCLDVLLFCLEEQLNDLSSGLIQKINKNYIKNLYGYNEWLKYKFQNETITAKITGISKFGELELLKLDNQKIKCGLKEIEFIFS